MKIAPLMPILALFALASCQSMSSGILSLEARALVLDDADIDDIDDGNFDTDEVDLNGYGLHAAFMTPILDILGGVETREFEDEDAPELVIGLRRRFFELWRVHPFIEGNVRYGLDLDNGFEEEDYFGWQIGGGAILDITDHLFLSARLMYESTEVDRPFGGSTDITGLVGTLGIGWAF
ncbi:MAG: hypothetical protein AAGA20_24590 [Planctomycetota bacterium]